MDSVSIINEISRIIMPLLYSSHCQLLFGQYFQVYSYIISVIKVLYNIATTATASPLFFWLCLLLFVFLHSLVIVQLIFFLLLCCSFKIIVNKLYYPSSWFFSTHTSSPHFQYLLVLVQDYFIFLQPINGQRLDCAASVFACVYYGGNICPLSAWFIPVVNC